jgi:ABC-type sulfate/molybdate transport systems ATPase subunit
VNEITVPLKARFYQDGPSFKNFFLHGESGAGKSMILNYISLWASKAGYLVINVRDAENWTRNPRKGAEGRRLKCGLFAQNAEAKVWLQSFLECNSALLE